MMMMIIIIIIMLAVWMQMEGGVVIPLVTLCPRSDKDLLSLLGEIKYSPWNKGNYYLEGPVHTTQNCVYFAKKICQHEAVSNANEFFHPRKFSQSPLNFKDAMG